MKVKIIIKKGIDKEELDPFYKLINKYELKEAENILDADLIVSFGGDGTILSLINYLKIKKVPVFAINYGNVGYMTKFTKENYLEGFKKYLKGEYTLEKREFLDVDIDGKIYYALNEMSILKCGVNSKMIRVMSYQEDRIINEYRGDGIIVCSPTGSTAYSLSSNGPIITNDVKCICITPLAPQSLSARSIILSPNKKLYFSIKSSEGYAALNLDGNFYKQLDEKTKISLSLSDFTLDLIDCFNINYFDILKQKLHWS